jgi:hypothetical protein
MEYQSEVIRSVRHPKTSLSKKTVFHVEELDVLSEVEGVELVKHIMNKSELTTVFGGLIRGAEGQCPLEDTE